MADRRMSSALILNLQQQADTYIGEHGDRHCETLWSQVTKEYEALKKIAGGAPEGLHWKQVAPKTFESFKHFCSETKATLGSVDATALVAATRACNSVHTLGLSKFIRCTL